MTRIAALVLLVPALATAAPVQDTDISHYAIIGIRRVRLKNFAMEPSTCHVGVNCPAPFPSSPCGVMHGKKVRFSPISQAVADHICATGTFYEVFRNQTSACAPDCTTISDPGGNADCSTTPSLPLIGDLDGDGNPSCAANAATCTIDSDDVAAACGIVLPLPACDPSRPIVVQRNGDCSSDDLVPGNFQCDLPAGTYGTIFVRDGARIEFGAGTTVACSVRAGKATRLKSAGQAKVLVPAPGFIKINNGSDAGSFCDTLQLVTEGGKIRFGRNGDYGVDACSIGAKLDLGHGNNLQGRFIGLDVGMDLNNDGRCCVPEPPPTTTTVTSTTVTTTTVTTTTVTTTTTSSTTTTAATTSTTTTTNGSTTTTTVTTTSTTTTSAAGSTTTTTTGAGSTTTTTTLVGGLFTRTVGFYKNHPDVTQAIIDAHGAFTICGQTISDTDVDHAHSAIEVMCVSPMGDQRLQLARQLTAAALTTLAGGGQYDGSPCNVVCTDPNATVDDLTVCIDAADSFNNSGDNVPAPWDPSGPANTAPCDVAANTACTIVNPGACAEP
jgi:hypothetical protein